jgi:predicted secreted protein
MTSFYRTLCLTLAIGLAAATATAQPGSPWDHLYGDFNIDICYAVQQTLDGGYILAGETQSFGAGGRDFWLVKADSVGGQVWAEAFGGTMDDVPYAVAESAAGRGFLVAGSRSTRGAGLNGWAVQTSAEGDSEWTHMCGGNGTDEFEAVLTLNDHYLLAGYTNTGTDRGGDFWLFDLSSDGDSLASFTYGGTGEDRCYAIAAASDGGYFLAGSTQSFGPAHTTQPNYWLVRINDQGDTLWTRAYGGNGADICRGVVALDDGGCVLGGQSASFGAGGTDFWLLRVNANGDSVRSKTYGTTRAEECRSLIKLSSGCLLAAGMKDEGGMNGIGMWAIETDLNLDSAWSVTYNEFMEDRCFAATATQDGGCALAGRTVGTESTDFWLVKVSAAAETLSANPDTLNFGMIAPGDSVTRTFTLENTGTVRTRVTGVVTPTGYHSNHTSGFNLASNGTVVVTVTFRPDTAGIYDDTVWMTGTARNNPFPVIVTGTAVTGGIEFVADPDSLNLGSVIVGDSSSAVFSVRNTGQNAMTISSIENLPGFLTDFAGPHEIAIGDTLAVHVRFRPDSAGHYDDTLWVNCAMAMQSVPVRLVGEGLANDAETRSPLVPGAFALLPAFPNPFNPQTVLTFQVPRAGRIRLVIWDVNGRIVQTLTDRVFEAGTHSMLFTGAALPSGVYFAQLQGAAMSRTQKLVLLK